MLPRFSTQICFLRKTRCQPATTYGLRDAPSVRHQPTPHLEGCRPSCRPSRRQIGSQRTSPVPVATTAVVRSGLLGSITQIELPTIRIGWPVRECVAGKALHVVRTPTRSVAPSRASSDRNTDLRRRRFSTRLPRSGPFIERFRHRSSRESPVQGQARAPGGGPQWLRAAARGSGPPTVTPNHGRLGSDRSIAAPSRVPPSTGKRSSSENGAPRTRQSPGVWSCAAPSMRTVPSSGRCRA